MIYKDIEELPLRVYDKISKTGNLTYLLKEKAEEVDAEMSAELLGTWDDIQKQLFDQFGVDDKTIYVLRRKIDYIQSMKDYYLDVDKMGKTFADIIQQEIDSLSNEQDGSSSMIKTVVIISKSLDMRLDYNSLTVAEFYEYMKLAEEINKAKSKK